MDKNKIDFIPNTSTCWRIVEELSSIYEDRLSAIDKKSTGYPQGKIEIYKEWVDVLKGVLWDSIEILKELEHEASKRLNNLQNKVNSGCEEERHKLKIDVFSLIKIIKRALEQNIWCTTGLDFCTITLQDIFGDKYVDLPFQVTEIRAEEEPGPSAKRVVSGCEDAYSGNIRQLLKATLRENEELRHELNTQKQRRDQYPDLNQRKKSIGDISSEDKNKSLTADSTLEMAKSGDVSDKLSSGLSETDLSLDKVIARESTRIRQFEEKEEEYFQLLNSELKDIWKTYTAKGEDFQDKKDIILRHSNKINKVIQDLLKDLSTSRKKLNFVRLQLRCLIGDSPGDGATIDSGYTSQEEYEPENTMITAVNEKLICLTEENKDLRQKLHECRKTIQRNGESYEYRRKAEEQRKKALENNDIFLQSRIFEAVSFTLSQVMKKQTRINNENELCNALRNLEIENDEKENLLNSLQSSVEKHQENINTFEKCSKEQEQTINQLKEIVNYQKDSEKIFEKSEKKLKTDLNTTKEEHDNCVGFKKILEEKKVLEIECQNQMETIKNLRLALETFKRNSGNIGPSTTNGNPIWNWWRGNIHDV